jgi:peptidoglycan/xylan/chitin deacetylase (PgdA/CDA1 family)
MTTKQLPISRRQFLAASAMAGAGLAASGASSALAASTWLYSPILMYHHVGALPPNPDATRVSLTVPPELFAAHLDALVASGYSVIGMAALWDGLANGSPLPTKPVVLTFDDGYDDAYQFAAPALAARGMTGLFHVITGLVEQPGYLTWAQVAEMRAAGMEIGNHTVHHPDLWWLSTADRWAEIEEAAQAIAAALGERPKFLSYPIGHYNTYIAEIVRQTGHLAATITHFGTLHSASYPYWMSRVRVEPTTTVEDLLGMLDMRV